MEISVVVPVYNEARSLVLFQQELHEAMQKSGRAYEIIYIDDGSSDGSMDTLRGLKSRYPLMRILSFAGHYGKSAALLAGFRAAGGAWIITLDSDLQNPPAEILKFLPLLGTCDLAIGIRSNRQDTSFRKLSSATAYFCRKLILGDTTQDTGCGLRMFRKEIVPRICFFRNFHRFFAYLAREEGFLIREVAISHDRRKFGKSKYGVLRRTGEGIFDLAGVLWLKKRSIKYEIRCEY